MCRVQVHRRPISFCCMKIVDATRRLLYLFILTSSVSCSLFDKEEANSDPDVSPSIEGDGLSAQDAAILDTAKTKALALSKVKLPNGEYLTTWAAKNDSAFFYSHRGQVVTGVPESGPLAKKNVLISRLVNASEFFTNPKNHDYKDEGPNKPAQIGLRYAYGQRDWTSRDAANSKKCTQKLHGLDCSGLLYNIFKRAGVEISSGGSVSQFNTASLTKSIQSIDEYKKLSAEELDANTPLSKLQTGDIIFWPNAPHIGLIIQEVPLTVVQSNGSSSSAENECSRNASPGRGPSAKILLESRNSWLWNGNYANYRIIRINAEISGKWDFKLRCIGQTTDVVNIPLNFPTKEDNKFQITTNATDYNGGSLNLVFNFSYSKKTNVLDCSFVVNGNGGARTDKFSVLLQKDDTGYITCTKVVANGGCVVQARLINKEK